MFTAEKLHTLFVCYKGQMPPVSKEEATQVIDALQEFAQQNLSIYQKLVQALDRSRANPHRKP